MSPSSCLLVHVPLSCSLIAHLEVEVENVAAGLKRTREAGRNGAKDRMRKAMSNVVLRLCEEILQFSIS